MDNKRLFYILIFSLLLKVVLAFLVPVYADEAYYYVWSLHPQLSYFDHPPMVSWLIHLANVVFPYQNPLALRSFFILASTLTMLTWVLILKRKKFSDEHIEYFLILMMLNPLLGPGSIVATPDVPLVLFWSLSYLFFLDVVQKKTSASYILLGIGLGLGFCSKYHIVLFVLSGLVYLGLSKKFKELVLPKILLTLFFGLLFCFPVVLWNYQNNWSSFSFQLKHGFGRIHYEWDWTASFILGQIFILNPFLLKGLFQKKNDSEDKIFALSQFSFFLMSSFKAVVEANWPITSHLHATNYSLQSLTKTIFKRAVFYWGFVYFVFCILAWAPQAQNLFKNQINSAQLNELLPLVDQYKPLYGPNYQISSLLSWMSQKEIYKLRGLTRYDFYDSLELSVPKEKEFYVIKHMTSIWPENYQKMLITHLQTFEKQQVELFRIVNE